MMLVSCHLFVVCCVGFCFFCIHLVPTHEDVEFFGSFYPTGTGEQKIPPKNTLTEVGYLRLHTTLHLFPVPQAPIKLPSHQQTDQTPPRMTPDHQLQQHITRSHINKVSIESSQF